MTLKEIYNDYKKSRVHGLEKIPAHWIESKFRYVTNLLTDYTANGSFKSLAENVEYIHAPDYARLIRLTDLRTQLKNDGIYVSEHSYNFLKKSALYGGEYLIANVGAYAGLVMQMPQIEGPATLGPNMMMAKFDSSKVLNKFMIYLSNSEYIQKQLMLKATSSSAQPKLNKEDFRTIEFVYPTLEEQEIIVKYLDKSFANINKIIQLKEKEVTLLEEKHQSIITEAVTKGLNPKVKMKDSGVDWIGEIPEHWELRALKRNFVVCNGREIVTELDRDAENAINVYGSGGVFKKTDKALYEGESVLFGRKGTIGKPLYVNEEFWTVDTMYYSKFSKHSLPKFFYYLLLIFPWDLITTHTALPSVVGTDVGNSICAIPQYEEQKLIVEKLDEETIKIDEAINLTKIQIQKLKEYSHSLIFEAVTGKIDVRELVIEKMR